ncbi:MAG TPA: hypothetical protein VFV66_12835, partial [Nonomuraea sp.]|nr:hypothetical protein [Nonomuraea sp.]
MRLAWIVALTTATTPLTPAPAPAVALPGAVPPTLTCSVTMPFGRPLTFSPGIGLTPRRVTVRGHLQFTQCTSPDGRAAGLSSAWVSLKATATASCTSARRVRGAAVLTWFGPDGRPVGTSGLRVRADRLATQSPANTVLTGTVRSGPLQGRRARGGITPPAGLLTCVT